MSEAATIGKRGRRSLWGMLAASGIAIVGTRITIIALPWFVLQETGSSLYAGLLLAAEMTPYVIAKALGGPLVDRRGPRLVSIGGDLLSGMVLLLIPLLYALGQLNLPDRLPLLLGIAALAGLLRGPGDGARNAMVPAVADDSGVPLAKVTGWDSTVDNASVLLGAPLGGLLVGLVGAPYAILISGLAAWLSALIVLVCAPRTVYGANDGGSYFERLRGGARFLREDVLLRRLILTVAATNTLDAAYISVFLPSWAVSHGYGPEMVGFLGFVYTGTAVIASLAATARAGRYNKRVVYAVGLVLAGAPRFLPLAFGAPLWLVIVGNVIAGMGLGFLDPVIATVFYERVPRNAVGRVGAIADAVAWSGIPLGGVAGGLAVSMFGLSQTLGVAGVVYAAAAASPTTVRDWGPSAGPPDP